MELLEILSKQEIRIAREVTLGYSEKEIAARLFISPKPLAVKYFLNLSPKSEKFSIQKIV